MRLQQLTPMLSVSDLRRTVAFYCHELGFRCSGTFGDPDPMWCHLERDGMRLLWFGQDTNEPPTVSE